MSINLINFFDWFSSHLLTRPWLIIGKGPTFDLLDKVDLSKYHVIGLNHVMFKVPCLLGHVIDFDVIKSSVSDNLCQHIVTPWEPHINNSPGGKTALSLFNNPDIVAKSPVLWYNSSRSAPLMIKSGPVIRVRGFSAVAAVNLLSAAGVKEVFTLGVDGGTKYSSQFKTDTLLANGRSSFDCQAAEFKYSRKKFNIKVIPLYKGLFKEGT
jgi:hypothetical protein